MFEIVWNFKSPPSPQIFTSGRKLSYRLNTLTCHIRHRSIFKISESQEGAQADNADDIKGEPMNRSSQTTSEAIPKL